MITNLQFQLYLQGGVTSVVEIINEKKTVVLRGLELGNIAVTNNIECPLEILIENCVFTEGFKIDNGTYNDRFIIKKCEFRDFAIWGGNFSSLFINECQVANSIDFVRTADKASFPMSVSLEYNKAKRILVMNCDFEYINFYQNDVEGMVFSNSLFIPETADTVMEHVYSKVKYFNFSLKEKTNITIEYLEVEKIFFRGSLNNAEIDINWIKAKEFNFEGFTKPNSGTLKISRLRPIDDQSSVTILNTFLGNTFFYDCNFSAFKKFSVANSYFIDLIYTNTTWPKHIDVAGADRFFPSNYSKNEKKIQLREVFRQLKISASKQGDKLQEALFYRNEMFWLNKTLSGWTHLSTKCSLILGLISSNHKQNWFYPIAWMMGLNFLFVMTVYFKINPDDKLYCDFNVITFISMLNPAHSFNDLAIEKNTINIVIDFLSRIINSFLIYQTVTAFRKLS